MYRLVGTLSRRRWVHRCGNTPAAAEVSEERDVDHRNSTPNLSVTSSRDQGGASRAAGVHVGYCAPSCEGAAPVIDASLDNLAKSDVMGSSRRAFGERGTRRRYRTPPPGVQEGLSRCGSSNPHPWRPIISRMRAPDSTWNTGVASCPA